MTGDRFTGDAAGLRVVPDDLEPAEEARAGVETVVVVTLLAVLVGTALVMLGLGIAAVRWALSVGG